MTISQPRTSTKCFDWYFPRPRFCHRTSREKPRKLRQRYSWGKWVAILADKCPWPQSSMAFEAWCDLSEWKEYFEKGYSPHVAIGLRFGYLKEVKL